jgi:hypothetical protein
MDLQTECAAEVWEIDSHTGCVAAHAWVTATAAHRSALVHAAAVFISSPSEDLGRSASWRQSSPPEVQQAWQRPLLYRQNRGSQAHQAGARLSMPHRCLAGRQRQRAISGCGSVSGGSAGWQWRAGCGERKGGAGSARRQRQSWLRPPPHSPLRLLISTASAAPTSMGSPSEVPAAGGAGAAVRRHKVACASWQWSAAQRAQRQIVRQQRGGTAGLTHHPAACRRQAGRQTQ